MLSFSLLSLVLSFSVSMHSYASCARCEKKKKRHLFFFFFFFCPFALVTNLDIKEASKQLNDNNNNNNDRTRERLTSLDSTHGENEQKTVQTTPSFPLHTYIHVYRHIYMCVYVGRASSTCTRHTPCLVQSSRQSKKKKRKEKRLLQ